MIRGTVRAFSSKTIPEITRVGMVGLGLMGHGIAQTAAMAGYDVVAVDMTQKSLDAGLARIEGSLNKLHARHVKKGDWTTDKAKDEFAAVMGRIHGSVTNKDLADCDLVIEAIVENVDIKKVFYKELGGIVKPSGILASNTSSLSIGDFAGSSGRPSQVVGLHFFNPVQLMKLVEVVETSQTDPKVFDISKRWAASLGKTPVSCKDTPGFIVNRLLVPNLAQALFLMERGDASMEDIDISMQLGAGHPMGPITLADYVGLDTTLSILEGWVKKYPNEPIFAVPESLRQKVKEGKLGRKTGEGYYKWDGDKRL
ncbi:hydroxyacyl-coenzyme A dehydrogenase, mitochondrial precursor [Thraustotheca clavata]|uniref:Hydroxyacyl-coenzyme A dehydrogenase, mitochondrial n=1 Tax=Thraustotheca clavata TaxID=74557 RepID=A0A1V9ZBB2_9STRA|nr:hydroxyacyl-coenzyme A dehydrogenase, mitochondrial precursor [Thraustotheca clavata]